MVVHELVQSYVKNRSADFVPLDTELLSDWKVEHQT
jgi:hypothetical protein